MAVDGTVAVTNGVCHYLVAEKGRHPETESKKEGLCPSAERHRLEAADHENSQLTHSQQQAKFKTPTPNVLKPSCAEKNTKRITEC